MANSKGVFTVELAMVLLVLSGFFAMQVNYMIAVAKKGALDRAAFSAVTLVSERRQFFDDEGQMCGTNGNDASKCASLVSDIEAIVAAGLARSMASFDASALVVVVEEYIPAPPAASYAVRSSGNREGCGFASINHSGMDPLSPLTSKARKLPIYQVSLCYRTDFNLIGVSQGDPFNIVASSISYARF
ncbi:tight adherence pilus pseudopilin TadF [Ferrimonas sp. SCSIO 43195]|uniref:tight adherence pilus pseudopilin TadF n=1 Tax=Ferrimonas sp. SCSIO 43195 TaxID=2822844 RepID=UPI002075B9CA|nr:tight adherence pilus pseudopilin TadF [Ferrimonas sp. SCSIO 43195]USD38921.1 hypothetical protein J8Z22_07410 [Ferrimonas sp. SCSIO 43195]